MEDFLLNLVHKLRDRRIIEAFSRYVPELVGNLPDALSSQLMNIKPTILEAAVILQQPHVEIPLLLAANAERDEAPRFEDPSTTGRPVELLQVMSAWEPFQEETIEVALYGFKTIMTALQSGRTTTSMKTLQAALESFYDQGGKVPTHQFIERLWRHRWIYEADMSAYWLMLAALVEEAPTDPEQAWVSLAQGEEPGRILTLIEERLGQAKINSKDLDDWFESLYLITPWVKYAKVLYKADSSDDGKKHLRWLEEVIADIYSIWFIGIEMLLQRLMAATGPYYWAWSSFEGRIEEATLIREMRELSYGYRARVQYPRFWFEAVGNAIQERQNPPIDIGNFNPRRLISIVITYSPTRAARLLGHKHHGDGDDSRDRST